MSENDRQKAIGKALEILDLDPVFLDTETTGLDDHSQAVEIAVISLDGTVLLDTLVKPTIVVSRGARQVHGIGSDELVDAPEFNQVLPELERVLRGRVIVGYNFHYDWQILNASAYAHGLDLDEIRPAEHYCVMELYAQYWGEWDEYHGNYRWQRLTDAARQQGVSLPEGMAPHRAEADAELTRRVLIAMAMADLPVETDETIVVDVGKENWNKVWDME